MNRKIEEFYERNIEKQKKYLILFNKGFSLLNMFSILGISKTMQ